ncbi:MAG: ParB/RepB/Spo0J family partition protein [Planctomycetota bacterium]
MGNSIKSIELAKLIEHPENTNRMNKSTFEKLVRHISRSGFYEPVIVRTHPVQEGFFEIINGHHRVKALHKLGCTVVDCVLWEVDDNDTRLLLATLNRLCGKDDVHNKALLYKRLNEKFDSSSLSKLLVENKSKIEKLVSSVNCRSVLPVDVKYDMPQAEVFFVDAEQHRIVEEALDLAAQDSKENSKAKQRAHALTRIAKAYIDDNRKIGKQV